MTYGDRTFAQGRERLAAEARQTGLFSRVLVYTEATPSVAARKAAQCDEFRDVCGRQRGGGYWLWKPFVVLEALASLPEGAVLVWADAGCEIKEPHGELALAVAAVARGEPCFLASPWGGPRHAFVKGDIVATLLPRDRREAFWQGRAFCIESNRFVIRKCEWTVALIAAWESAARAHPHLFSDQPSAAPNQDGFIENRHDQSVLQALLHERGWDWQAMHDEWCGVFSEDAGLLASRIRDSLAPRRDLAQQYRAQIKEKKYSTSTA